MTLCVLQKLIYKLDAYTDISPLYVHIDINTYTNTGGTHPIRISSLNRKQWTERERLGVTEQRQKSRHHINGIVTWMKN